MKTKKQSRGYTMTARAEAAAQTERNILEAVVSLWQERSIHDITLEVVAERAGVTVRTVLRKYGSKEGLFEASIQDDVSGRRTSRDEAPVGDIDAALSILLADYEKMGDANVRTLAVEEEMEVARMLLQKGRAFHKAWCARVFAPYLPEVGHPDYETRLLSFYAATEIYLWKLLRRDMGKSLEETRAVFHALLTGLINSS